MRDFGDFTSSTNGSAGRSGAGAGRHALGLWLVAASFVFFAGLTLTAFAMRDLSGGQALLSQQQSANGEPSALTSGGSSPVNVLLMGLDGGKDEHQDGVQRADTLMLARMYPETGEVRLLSIPRDLYVQGAGPDGGSDRINSAYAHGGVEATVDAVEDFAGAPVNHYVSADFGGFEQTVDALGGVEVQVERDYLAHRGIPSGEQVLDGKEALLYARYRKTPRGDLGRIERQRQLLYALRSEVLSWDAVGGSPGLVRSVNQHVETDMGVSRMVALGRGLARGEGDGGIKSYELEGEPVTLQDGREVLDPDEERNEEILFEFLR